MPAPTEPRLSLRGVSRDFALSRGERRPVLDDVSFDVEPGSFVSIVGPSGCGKSTLFNIIAGLDTPTAGSVLADGVDVRGSAGHAAYMPQKDLLFPWRTIAQNVALGLEVQGRPRREARRQVRDSFAQFGLEGFEDALPFELSGGMRQRAALLRTVVQQRRTLLLDEPFGALDALTKRELHDWLQRVWIEHDWTALLITHDVREAVLLSDRIIVLGPRPASVRLVLDVDLPKPRTLAVAQSPEFAALERAVLAALGAGAGAGTEAPAAAGAAPASAGLRARPRTNATPKENL
ncbi:ABC transporter ATP-binding protein [Leucobacter sp. UCMA 4100]|uniref:ABC transporter ATP-binding protein n=1 Tax=Leucobacter sp. UCMA 4100 TaxID=2810534 RepID=UPI0022EB8B51|nr:ABC transporter ATP-binding protein [Leucobacter sp. UCMA 4100]MDA3147372.1 ABC transporter ATP-binding protein [Leucobacter sp. UCMA 4100]